MIGAIAAVAVNAAGASVLLVDSLGCAQPFAASLAAMVLYSAFIMVGHRQKLATGTALGAASTAAAASGVLSRRGARLLLLGAIGDKSSQGCAAIQIGASLP